MIFECPEGCNKIINTEEESSLKHHFIAVEMKDACVGGNIETIEVIDFN